MNDWNFEVFSMNECSDGQALRYLGFELMQKFNILQKFKVKFFLLNQNY
jgi:calcium/calmodulin-dependent 3',5'-cyclic nucleotide phosphodiesterase